MDRVEHGIEWLHAFYGEILEWALGHRKSVIAIAVVSFLASFAIVPLVGTEFIPSADEGFISLRLNTPVGSSLEYTDGKVQQVEAALKSLPGHRADDDDRGIGGGPQLRARQPEAHRSRRAHEDAEGDRGGDPQGAEADSRHRARVRLRPAGVGQPAGTGSRDADHADQRVRGEGRARSRASRTWRRRRRRRPRRCRSGSTTTPRPTSGSPCSRSARRSGRCSPATR